MTASNSGRGSNSSANRTVKKGAPAPEADQVIRVRIPRKEDREVLAIVESLLGANHLKLRCMDGVVRMGRIPGSMKKKIWIHEGDVVIAVPWDFQDEKADIIWKYTRPQVDWLDKKGFLRT
ncbi:translation initiation factor eIF-1A [Methanolapillus millepedarum]|uniref:translation initiation factor eIF-1A n=1 Tax=Methanolapillus millepedarum TaxID=3028296 RepID=UPI0030B8DAA9